jgi:hypothetical protein
MSAYSPQLAFRLRGKITADVDTIPLSEPVVGNVIAANSFVDKVSITGFDETLNDITEGDYLFIKGLKEARRISGVSNAAGPNRVIYVDGEFSAPPPGDEPLLICRIASSGILQATRITIINDGASDAILDNNPDAVLGAGEDFTIVGRDTPGTVH